MHGLRTSRRAPAVALMLIGCALALHGAGCRPGGGDDGGTDQDARVDSDGGGTDAGDVDSDGGADPDDASTPEDGGTTDLCEDVDCSSLDDACNVGTCDATTGDCEAVPVADDTACDDGSACTSSDVCSAGACAGTAVDCSASTDMCNVGTCNATTGACEPVPVADATTCDDASACTIGDVCTAGTCAGVAVDCSASTDMCNVGMCDASTGACTAVPVADATPCDDGSLCSVTDVCTSGICGGTAVDCSAMTDTCNVGTCDATDGSCNPVPVADGTSCSDGAACTTADTCTGGTCAGSAVDCSAVSDMCNVGTCSAIDGSCGPIPVADGTTCADAFACTVADACGSGECGGRLGCRGVPASGSISDTAQRGNLGGGVLYEDRCPAGQVLIGFHGFLTSPTGYHGRLQGICGTPHVVGTTPATYSVAIDRTGLLPMRGILGSTEWERLCPANQTIVGFSGRSGALIDQLTFTCAPLTVGDADAGYAIGVGTTRTPTAPAGGPGGTPFPEVSCAAGLVAVEQRPRAGDGIDAFGLGCAAPALAFEAVRILTDCSAGAGEVDSYAGTACHDLSAGARAVASWAVVPPFASVTLYRDAGCAGPSRLITTSASFCGLTYSDGTSVNDRLGSYRISY